MHSTQAYTLCFAEKDGDALKTNLHWATEKFGKKKINGIINHLKPH